MTVQDWFDKAKKEGKILVIKEGIFDLMPTDTTSKVIYAQSGWNVVEQVIEPTGAKRELEQTKKK